MKIVIDIKDADYYDIIGDAIMGEFATREIINAVKEGTLLPKGHGRLIDADELEECKEIMNTISGESKYAIRMDDIRNISTIIEADKAESEE